MVIMKNCGSPERRTTPRYAATSEHMVEFVFAGNPIYQLKAKDISETGIGVIVKPNSKFMSLIEIGQEMVVKLLSPAETRHVQGNYRVKIAHITDLENGKFSGHKLVALTLVTKISD